jgi:tRNA threonylcarbamoyladenosine biosynthesis protein TsaB
VNVLAFDTATAATTVALGEFERRDDPPPGARPGHAQRLLALIQEILESSGSSWAEIDRIAVGVGPGTFTGLRIGIATAQALSQSTGIPLVGVSTLASLELGAREALGPGRPVLAVIDARRGEAFVAGPGISPAVLTPTALGEVAGTQASNGVIAIGDGALKFRETLEQAGATVPEDGSPLHRVCARYHCWLAEAAAPSEDNRVEPQYLRVPDAELKGQG